MNKSSIALLLAFIMQSGVVVAAEPDKVPVSRMATYDKTTGEIFFALSLLSKERVPDAEAVDVAILFDTSASQVGLYRKDALTCLERMIEGLREKDRIRIFAIDLRPVPMNDNWVAPSDAAVGEAIASIKKRTPLGSTDMPAGIKAAISAFDDESKAARCIVYIGDGVSRANFINAGELTDLLADLRKARAPVSSFTIGPQRNVELLATLANHSGGVVAIDSEGSDTAVGVGAALARVTRGTVLWPVEAKMPEAILVSYPEQFPPLRMDRDTVLLGMLKSRTEVTLDLKVSAGDDEKSMTWKITPEAANSEFGFLPNLVEMAAKDGGIRLPTAGSGALREVGRVILNNARTLLKLGSQAIKRDDFKAALSAAKSVLERDPDNPEAHALKRAAERGLRRQELKNKASKPDEAKPEGSADKESPTVSE